MMEIRFHGRGGQGAVTAANLLAEACFKEGKDVQAFPMFGVERRGAPVTAFLRVDRNAIRIKSYIYNPDVVVGLDTVLLESIDVTSGLKEDGAIVLNTDKKLDELGLKAKTIGLANATKIAIDHRLGSKASPIVNTAILGSFVKTTGFVKIDTVLDTIKEKAPAKREENAAAAKEAYENTEVYT
ncbi:MAG: 2-oxoacid:acceptor oxidoreductase family protein [Euryarchaeota archaeon]|nr:2-oxoacid:acceptor oxidoreductase family protein [Euryarchaeota archaeon]